MKPSKKLQRKWYTKLDQEGFKDLETFDTDMEPKVMLKGGCNEKLFAAMDKGNEEYYIHARSFFYNHHFESKVHKSIWKLHSAGISYNNILKTIPKTKAQIRHIVSKLKKIMVEQLTQSTIDEDIDER